MVLRAVERFFEAEQRYPGWQDNQAQTDVAKLRAHLNALLGELGVDVSSVPDTLVQEVCRFGAAELHNIAAFMGGVASQEAIKVVTGQWMPIDHTLIYNGINSTTTYLTI